MAIAHSVRAVSSAVLAGTLVFASASAAAADQVRDGQWALKSLEAEAAWEASEGEGQTVAVIDYGVDGDHVDLSGNVLQGKNVSGGGAATPDPEDPENLSHGTGMASLIAGHGHGPGGSKGVKGLAPKAKILPIMDSEPSEDGLSRSIRYAVDHKATVINISLGDNDDTEKDAEKAAIKYALDRDVLIVAGTGNAGGPVNFPARYPGVLSVGGVGEEGKVWSKSGRGPQTLLTAPATNIVSASAKTKQSYRSANGTSDATALTSGAAALLRSKYPDLSAGQIANRLTKTATLPDSEKDLKLPDEKYGYGTIQPLAALTEKIPKGSHYGPLSVPHVKDEFKEPAPNEGKPSEQDVNALENRADQKQATMLTILGVVAFLIIAAVVGVVVVLVRKKKQTPEPPMPANFPGQAPGYGPPPNQQGPNGPNTYSSQEPRK